MTDKQTPTKRLLSKKIKPWHVAALVIIAACYLILQFTLSSKSTISQSTKNGGSHNITPADTNKDRTQSH